MTRKLTTIVLPAAAFILAFIFTGQTAQADWGVSFYGETSSPRYASYGDRLTSDYRRGFQVDDWLERGASSVTQSPVFTDGVRLAAWRTGQEDDHDFALASAIYFFEIPDRARSIRVKIYYEGEADRGDFNGGITGRAWVRRAYIDENYTEYDPEEGTYEDGDQPLYGDTFVLRAKKHLEILRMSAEDHVIDGMMELHVVAEGRQRMDVKYIEVETYSYFPSVRVVTRYYKDYTWKPWYNYTYGYFYTGPSYHFADNYYVRYTYPRHRYHYSTIRKRYNNYLRVYYVRRPEHRVRWSNVSRVSRGTRRTWNRDRLGRWTREHDNARKSYVVTSAKKRRADEVQKSRVRIRSVLSSRTRVSPATTRARSGVRTAVPSARRRTTIQTRGSGSTDVRRRREATSSSVRTRTQPSRDSQQTQRRVETPSRTRATSTDTRSSARTRSSSPGSQQTSTRSVRQTSTRSSERQQPTRSVQKTQTKSVQRTPARSTSSSQTQTQTTKKRQVTRTRAETRKSGSSTKQAPSTPAKTSKDEDDDDDDKKKSSTTRSSSSKSSTTTRKKVKTR